MQWLYFVLKMSACFSSDFAVLVRGVLTSLSLLSLYVYMCHFTDPLTCSFLILSFSVTPHVHPIIVISFTSSLLSSRFVVTHVYAPALLSISSCCTHPMSYLHTNTSVHLNNPTRSCSPFSTDSHPTLFPCVSPRL